MTAEIVVSHGAHGDVFSGVHQIDQVGCIGGKYGDTAVDDIVFLLMDEKEHEHQRQCLEDHRADGDVGIFLQSLVHPLHSHRVEQDHGTDHEVQRLVRLQPRDGGEGEKEQHIHDGAHDEIDDHQLLHRAGQFDLILPHLGAGPDAVSGDPQLGDHQKIHDEGVGKTHRSRSRRSQHAGHVGKGDQRKNKR